MHQSCTIPKLASPVSGLLGRDTDGYRYGAHMEAVKDLGRSKELEAGNSSGNAFSSTVSIERAGPLVKAEESIRSRAATEKFCGHIQDVYAKGASTAQGQSVDTFDRSFLSKCAQRLQGHEGYLSALHEKVELIVQLNQDMPIVGTSSTEKQVDTSVVGALLGSASESLQGSVAGSLQDRKLGVIGCASVKRERSHQDSEEARAEKRVKVEGDNGLPWNSVNGNAMGPSVPHRGVEDCQDTNPGDEPANERDGLRPWVQDTEISTAAPNDTDLTDLLNDLDDAGDSDLDEDEFEYGSHLLPEAVCDEWLGNGSIKENGVHAYMPQADTIVKALNISSDLAQKDDDIGTNVQGHSPQPEMIPGALGSLTEQAQRDDDIGSKVQAHTPQPETSTRALNFSAEQAQRDGDIGSKVQAHTPQRETSTRALGSLAEHAQRDGDIGSKVQVHTPLPATSTRALGFSAEHAQRDGDIGSKVQAPDTIRREKPNSEIVILDSDSDDDDDLIMFDHLDEASQLKNTVKSDSGVRQLEKNSSQLEYAVKTEPESLEQPEKNHQLENTVKVEPESLRQSEKSYQLGNAVKVEPESLRQPEKSSELVPNASSEFVPNEISELLPSQISELAPSESSQLANAVKLEVGGIRQVPDSKGSQGFEAATIQGILRAGQRQPGVMLQTIVQNGSLMWALVPQNTDTMPGSAFSANHVHPRPPQVNCLPNGLPYGLGCSSGFAPKNERGAPSSGERAGPSHGWMPPTTSAGVPYYRGHTQPSGIGYSNPAIAGQAVPSVPSPFQPAGNVQEASSSGEQARPSHGWTPPNSSVVVPYGFGHAQPSAMGNANHAIAGQAVPTPFQRAGNVQEAIPSGEQAGPSHGWTPPNTSAVVPYGCGTDSTVSTPRVEVARALQQYLFYINKAKDDRARELLAQRESTPNEIVREGNRRGLECRPDIVAYNDIKKAKADVNPGVNVGDLPGVQVGDIFTYRHQMAVVGLHRLPNVGIDYGHPPPHNIPTATAIVLMPKAGYVDDKDDGITILYTGQGGRKKRNQQAPFVCDQELKKGNLALAKNYERKLPVRVIRGHMGAGNSGPGLLGYSYDGLYMISSYEFSDGINGYKVFKYHMERLEDQPPIPPCIAGCTAHAWNTSRGAMAAKPLQVKDPNEDVKPVFLQVIDPPVEIKQICI